MTVTDWLQANVHRLRTLDPDDEDFGDLQPLREIVGDARVVSIGESTHRIHEFYDVRHRLTRFLVEELGFTALVMESGFAEGFAVDAWVQGGPGDLTELLFSGITYHMGKCAEVRDQLSWMRAYNDTHDRKVRFYGMDVADSAASARPAVEAVLAFLDDADPNYAKALRERLLPLFDYLPTDRTGLAWQAPALQAYIALPAATRHELTARINELAEWVAANRVVYAQRAGAAAADVACRCAATARHTDAFLAGFALGQERSHSGSNVRDLAMAENVEWILEREDRIVIGAANGHVQRWPFQVPPIIPQGLTMLGEHLAYTMDGGMVVIATTIGGGTMWLHRQVPEAPPGHTEVFTEELGPVDEPRSLDTLLAGAGIPLGLLDLRTVPRDGPVGERFAALGGVMNGPHLTLLDPRVAFDAVVHIDRVTPWHTLIDTSVPTWSR